MIKEKIIEIKDEDLQSSIEKAIMSNQKLLTSFRETTNDDCKNRIQQLSEQYAKFTESESYKPRRITQVNSLSVPPSNIVSPVHPS